MVAVTVLSGWTLAPFLWLYAAISGNYDYYLLRRQGTQFRSRSGAATAMRVLIHVTFGVIVGLFLVGGLGWSNWAGLVGGILAAGVLMWISFSPSASKALTSEMINLQSAHYESKARVKELQGENAGVERWFSRKIKDLNK